MHSSPALGIHHQLLLESLSQAVGEAVDEDSNTFLSLCLENLSESEE
jgi:hypothetical protein